MQHSDPSRKMSTLDCAPLFENKKRRFSYSNVINSQAMDSDTSMKLGLAVQVSLSFHGGN